MTSPSESRSRFSWPTIRLITANTIRWSVPLAGWSSTDGAAYWTRSKRLYGFSSKSSPLQPSCRMTFFLGCSQEDWGTGHPALSHEAILSLLQQTFAISQGVHSLVVVAGERLSLGVCAGWGGCVAGCSAGTWTACGRWQCPPGYTELRGRPGQRFLPPAWAREDKPP